MVFIDHSKRQRKTTCHLEHGKEGEKATETSASPLNMCSVERELRVRFICADIPGDEQ